MSAKSICPCCDTATLSEPNAYEICSECWWEDEGCELDEVGTHGVTLREARANYARYGAADPHGYWCKHHRDLPSQYQK